MRTSANYERPEMAIHIFEVEDTIRTSDLTNGGSGTGDYGELPDETNLPSAVSF